MICILPSAVLLHGSVRALFLLAVIVRLHLNLAQRNEPFALSLLLHLGTVLGDGVLAEHFHLTLLLLRPCKLGDRRHAAHYVGSVPARLRSHRAMETLQSFIQPNLRRSLRLLPKTWDHGFEVRLWHLFVLIVILLRKSCIFFSLGNLLFEFPFVQVRLPLFVHFLSLCILFDERFACFFVQPFHELVKTLARQTLGPLHRFVLLMWLFLHHCIFLLFPLTFFPVLPFLELVLPLSSLPFLLDLGHLTRDWYHLNSSKVTCVPQPLSLVHLHTLVS
mmetsp:Transcript_9585/g.22722  ORF Transcript_9585/g.22722 Transcript_9585/m.22722 type:complete len:276 (+) Transcript_9585:107-934(+)